MEPHRRFRDALIPSRLRIVLLILGFTLALALAPERRAVAEIVEYRSVDGAGNNIAHPYWGAAGANLLRGPSGAHYSDGTMSMGGATRPSPRALSNAFFAQTQPVFSSAGHSDYIWAWGQFLDHDFGLTPGANEFEPITVPQGDPFFDPSGTGTQIIPFQRSVFDTASNPRQQLNLVSGYIDANTVYGSNVGTDTDRAGWLRAHSGGRLKVTQTAVGDLLPYNDGTIFNAGTPEAPNDSTELFVAGDIRVNEQPTLAVLHTLFVREHNYQAARIEARYLGLSDEEIYQRARRIVIAEIQAITYQEFIPAFMGSGMLRPDAGYDPNVNAGINQVFSTAGFRLGHTLLSSNIQHLDENGISLPGGPLQLRQVFFEGAPPILEAEGIDPILRGLAAQQAQDLDNLVIDDVRNFLFGAPGSGGLDLISLNIQRGRDHGLPDFNTARLDLGLARKSSFSQITSDSEMAARLAGLYGNDIDNIDLFVGLLVEDDMPGAMVGETLRAILLDQFERSRAGDRFFYTRDLSKDELAEVSVTRLADIIRRNTGIRNIQYDVFFVRGRGKN